MNCYLRATKKEDSVLKLGSVIDHFHNQSITKEQMLTTEFPIVVLVITKYILKL